MDDPGAQPNAPHQRLLLPTQQAADAEARRLSSADPEGYWFAHEETKGGWSLSRLGGFKGRAPVPSKPVELPDLLKSGNGGAVGAG